MRRVFLILFALFACAFAAVPALARTVVVVYDDSGSMSNGVYRDVYAGYSLQVLRALLRPQDRLQVVYMNQAHTALYTGPNAQGDMKEIKTRAARIGGGTPYGAVEKATQLIEASTDDDKWLLVITDGNFEEGVPDALDSEIKSFVARNPSVRAMYLGIAQNESTPVFQAWERQAQATLLFADSEQQVVPVMAEIGGRFAALGAAKGKAGSQISGVKVQVSGNKIHVESRFPVKRLVFLQQNSRSGALVNLTAASAGEQPLRVGEALLAEAGRDGINLAARVQTLESADGRSIPGGQRMTIELNQAPAPDSVLTVFPEVDATMQLTFMDERGQRLRYEDSTHLACENKDTLVQALVQFPPMTGTPPKVDDAEVRLNMGGQNLPMRWNGQAFEWKGPLDPGERRATVSVTVPGYFDFHQAAKLKTVACAPRQVTLVSKPRGANGDASQPWSALLTALETSPPLEIYPLFDGKRAGASELEKTNLVLDMAGLHGTLTKTRTGWELQPTLCWGSMAFTRTGEFKLKARLDTLWPDDEKRLPDTIPLTIQAPTFWEQYGPFLTKLLAALTLAWYLYGLYVKPRLVAGSYVQELGLDGAILRKTYCPRGFLAWLNRWLVPYRAERLASSAIPLRAAPRGALVLPGRAVTKDTYFRDGMAATAGKDIRLISNQTITRGSGAGAVSFQYIKGRG